MAETFKRVFALCHGAAPFAGQRSASLAEVLQARANVAAVKAAASACDSLDLAKAPRIHEGIEACLRAGLFPGPPMRFTPLAVALTPFPGLVHCSDPLVFVRLLLPDCSAGAAEAIAKQLASHVFAPLEDGADAFDEIAKLGLVNPSEWTAAPFRAGTAGFKSREDASAFARKQGLRLEKLVINSWVEDAV